MNNITKICITCVICSLIISICIFLSNRYIVVSQTNNGTSILYIVDNITGELKTYNLYGEKIVRRVPEKSTTGTPNWRDYQWPRRLATYPPRKAGTPLPAFPLCGFESLMRVMGVVFELHNGIKIHLISVVTLRTALIGLMHLCYWNSKIMQIMGVSKNEIFLCIICKYNNINVLSA